MQKSRPDTDPPSVWLEWAELPSDANAQDPPRWHAASSIDTLGASSALELRSDEQLKLRCFVGANPLTQNSILQIEWLKDGRRLQAPATSGRGDQLHSHVLIERANHLHMPQVGSGPAGSGAAYATQQQQAPDWGRLNLLRSAYGEAPLTPLAGTSRLLASSQLTIARPLTQADTGRYSCQFKLIPAPARSQVVGAGGSSAELGASSMKILAGQASQAVQLRLRIDDEGKFEREGKNRKTNTWPRGRER